MPDSSAGASGSPASPGSAGAPAGTPTALPISLPVAPVATGPAIVNTLAPPGLVVRIHADYDRDGSVAASETEDLLRLLRPGAIILPNLDISDATRLPAPAVPAVDVEPLLDFKDDEGNGTLDETQLALARCELVLNIASRASKVVLRMDAKDAARVRGLMSGGPFGILRFDSLGGGVAEREVGDLLTGLFGGDVELRFEALAFPGDPKLKAPTGPSPVKPAAFTAKLPAGSSGTPVVAKRAPGDVWVEVVHQDSAGKDIPRPHDVALFTIAPLLFLGGHLPPKRVFVVNQVDKVLAPGLVPGNHNFIFDLMEGCQAAFGAAAVPLPASDSAAFTTSKPADTGPLYLIDGDKFPDPRASNTVAGFADPWIQDEIEIGYCIAPHASMHVVLHCRRSRGLDGFVHQEMPGPQVGLYDALHVPQETDPEKAPDGQHYGGNIEATPPIAGATPAMGAGAAGPAVKAHRPAPFGKVVLGDSKLRPVDADMRELMLSQTVQPVLPVDTSWLAVGHVDEFISFVSDSSAKGFKMLFASIGSMTALLEETKKVPMSAGRTHFHRGKWLDALHSDAYDEVSVEQLLTDSKPFNDEIRAAHLTPIDQRLKTGLGLQESDIVRMPTYFLPPTIPRPAPTRPGLLAFARRTQAQTIGSVNMLVLGKELVIPKPFGPRMPPAEAQAVLERVFKRLSIKAPVSMPLTGETRWVEPGETPDRLVCYYTDPASEAERANLIEHIKDPAVALSTSNQALVTANALALSIVNATNPTLALLLAAGLTATPLPLWTRMTIPDGKVCVVEAYLQSVLTPMGVTLHFVDDWFYHAGVGEAHCGTNCLREIPETTDPRRWWDHYDPTIDIRYSP